LLCICGKLKRVCCDKGSLAVDCHELFYTVYLLYMESLAQNSIEQVFKPDEFLKIMNRIENIVKKRYKDKDIMACIDSILIKLADKCDQDSLAIEDEETQAYFQELSGWLRSRVEYLNSYNGSEFLIEEEAHIEHPDHVKNKDMVLKVIEQLLQKLKLRLN
jgi:hypothetical protein